MNKTNGLTAKMKFEFDVHDDVPEFNFKLSEKITKSKVKNTISIVEKKKKKKDSSTNVNLF